MKKVVDRESRRSMIISGIGIGLVAIAYLGAVWNMLNTKREESWGGRKVIRICHWQLETGFRQGIDHAIREFQKQFPDVKVTQLPIYERAYKQFVQTQLIGGTAPDLIERGNDVTQNAVPRYFYSLSGALYEPNEFNADNELADVPWIATFKDALATSIHQADQEYYMVGLNNHTVRVFYNKTLHRRIVGHDRPPATYQELIDVCERVRHYSDSVGGEEPIFPIAGSKYQSERTRDIYLQAMTVNYLLDVLDSRFDLGSRGYDKYLAYLEERYDLDDDELRAAEGIHHELAQYYQPGFMATDRQEAGFAFAQQRALMISSGSWDYQSMLIQARDNGFEVGVFAFPLPGKDHPVYGKYVDGQPAEQNRSQVSFGLARTSKHPDVALRFLKFITSKRINEEINAIIGWIPSIRNADVVAFMKPFVPNTEGMPYVWLPMTTVGERYGKTGTNDAQAYWEFISGDIDFDHYIANIEKRFVVDGMADVIKGLREFEDGIVPMEHNRSFLTAQRVFARSEEQRREAAGKGAGINSTLVSRAIDAADQGYRLHRDASTLDNERVRRLVKTAEYGVFLKFYGFEGG